MAHVLAYAMGFPMRPAEKAQQQLVDSVLTCVEKTLAHQQTARKAVREGRVRVDMMVDDALKAARPAAASG